MAKRILSKIPLINRLALTKGQIKRNQPIEIISQELDAYVRLNLGHLDKIVLIAHSMGGLVAKAYLLTADRPGPVPVGFVSIAVPHKGSFGALVLGAILDNVNAAELTPLNAYADRLNSEWAHRKDTLPPSVYLVATNDECVPSVSAVPYKIPTEMRFSVPHDHLSICKPESNADLVYKCVSNFLKRIAAQAKLTDSLDTPYPDDVSLYDKEVFVIKMILSDIGSKGVENAKESFFFAEIIAKTADRQDRVALNALQSSVLSLYRTIYNKCNGKMNPNDVFAAVHQEIMDQDSNALKCTISAVKFLHKQGMLHRLANELTSKVVWSDDVTLEQVEAHTK